MEPFSWQRWADTRSFKPDGTYGVSGIPPGEEESGFSLWSAGLPAIVDAEADGRAGFGFYEGNGPINAAWGELADSLFALRKATRSVPFRTLGPRAVPEPLDGVSFLDSLTLSVYEAETLGWITDAATAADVRAALGQARSDLMVSDSVATRQALVGLLGDAEAGQGSVFTSEGYALVYLNAQHLVALLPEN